MRLIINTASTHQGGAVQVALSFITECINYPENEYLVILGPKLGEIVDNSSFPRNFQFYRAKTRAAENLFMSLSGSQFSKLEEEFNPDVVFTTSGPAYWKSKVPHLMGFNLPHYVYPESPYFEKIGFLKRKKWSLRGLVLKYFFKRDGDAFVCQTDDVSERVKQFLGTKKVYTVSNTFNSYYKEFPSITNEQPLLPFPKPNTFRLLMLSAYHEHKNFQIITPVLDELKKRGVEEVEFIVTIDAKYFETAFGVSGHPNIINVGPTEINKCPQLYQEVDAMFLPTLLECFSASYPEAMISKKPILTSNLGFAKTVCKEAALYFDAVNPSDVADKVLELKSDTELQDNLIERGLAQLGNFDSVKQRAEKYLQLCSCLIEEQK